MQFQRRLRVFQQQFRHLRPRGRRNQLRTPVSVAHRVGFFQHQVLARLEARDRHRKGKAQQQGQQAEQGGLQRRDVRAVRFIAGFALAQAQPEAELDDGQENDDADEEEIRLVEIPEHGAPRREDASVCGFAGGWQAAGCPDSVSETPSTCGKVSVPL